jgi:hypothetical protein
VIPKSSRSKASRTWKCNGCPDRVDGSMRGTAYLAIAQRARLGFSRISVSFIATFTRPADALQLAAAFVAAERRPSSLEVITVDERLAAAARKEGFVLIEVRSIG